MFKTKKLLSLALVAIMILSLGTNAFAANFSKISTDYNLVIVEDNPNVRIAETSDEEFIYRTMFDKVNNTVEHEIINRNTQSVKKADTVKLDNLVMVNGEVTLSAKADVLKENTFINYEYTKTYGNPHQWQLRRPKINYITWYYMDVEETTENKSYLNTFKGHVDDINVEEGEVIGAIGLAGLSYIATGAATWGALLTGGALTGVQWASILAAGGFTAAASAIVAKYDRSCKEAYDAYMEIKYL